MKPSRAVPTALFLTAACAPAALLATACAGSGARSGALAVASSGSSACPGAGPCGGAGGGPGGGGTGGTASGRTAAGPTPGEVLVQYRLFHAVVEEALATDDGSAIGSVATGSVEAALLRDVKEQLRQGIVRRGHMALDPRVRLLPGGREALVADCLSSTGLWTFRRDSGERVGAPARPTRSGFRALMVLDNGGWKVAGTGTPASARC